jgi:hypothetical protein
MFILHHFQDQTQQHTSIIHQKLVSSPDERTDSHHQLGLKRETIAYLAKLIWNKAGVILSMVSEIVSVYPFLASDSLILLVLYLQKLLEKCAIL